MPPQVLPEQVDLRDRLLPVEDQGERETCVAFAATAAHELSRLHSAILNLSEEVLFWSCVQLGADPARGTTFDVANKALQHTGQPEAHHWPYDPQRDASAHYTPPQAALDPDHCYRARLTRLPKTLERIKSELANDQAVMLGIPIWESIYLAPSGIIPMPQPEETLFGGHAVLAVGYNDNRHHLVLRNSWGEAWGDSGYGYVPYAYIQRHLITAWVVAEHL